jgi:hypothetical protein
MFAHVTAGTVDSVGSPPELTYSGGRWWDLRSRNTATLATVGWFPVTEATRPADTASTTWDQVFTPAGSVVVQSWVERAKTAEEIAAALADTNAAALLAGVAAEITRIETQIGLADAIAGSTTPKSTINADPGAYIKDLAKMVKRIGNANIRALRIAGSRYESASVGDTT